MKKFCNKINVSMYLLEHLFYFWCVDGFRVRCVHRVCSHQRSSTCCLVLLLLLRVEVVVAHHTSCISRHRPAQSFSSLTLWLEPRCRCQHSILHHLASQPVTCLCRHLPQPILWTYRYVSWQLTEDCFASLWWVYDWLLLLFISLPQWLMHLILQYCT